MRILKYLNDSTNSIAIMFSVAILSMAYPYGFPLFGLLALFFGFLKLITFKFKFRFNLGFTLFFLSVLFYLFGMMLSGGLLYSYNISDLTNIISFLLIWVLYSDLKKEEYPVLIHKIAKYTVIVSFVISLISLYKFYALLGGFKIQTFFVGTYYPDGSSLVRDYNMFSFALITGLVLSVYLISKNKNMTHMFFYLIAFISIFLSVSFAGSRRAWIVAAIIAVFLALIILKSLSKFRKNIVKFIKIGMITGFSALFIFLFVTLFNIDLDIQGSAQVQDLQYRLETLRLDQAEESFSPRTQRWEYSLDLFQQSNPAQLFAGAGFGYLTDIAHQFNPSLKEDYPHNPILSTLLYSGLIGAVALIILLIYSIFAAIKNNKLISTYFTFLYLISYVFVMVSSNTIFSHTLFILMLLLIISIPKNKNTKMETSSTKN